MGGTGEREYREWSIEYRETGSLCAQKGTGWDAGVS